MEAPADEGAFLVVEDDPLLSRALERFLGRYGRVRVAHTAEAAYRLLESERALVGAILDWHLPDGDGITVLRRVRSFWPSLPTLLLTAFIDASCIVQAHALRAEYLAKPAPQQNLRAFVDRCLGRTTRDRIEANVRSLARRHSLSRLERRLMMLAIAGSARSEAAEELGVSENTYKTIARRLLRKVGEPSLEVLSWRVRRMASETPPPP
jgi:two-component system, NtrC family, response regulator PilR